jgi:hypothetical protein
MEDSPRLPFPTNKWHLWRVIVAFLPQAFTAADLTVALVISHRGCIP